MKNIIFFILLLMLIGCGSKPILTSNKAPIKCPTVLFASEHRIYFGSDTPNISEDNIKYKAEINNYNFSKGCFMSDNFFSANLSILFIATSESEEHNIVTLPFYIAILDDEKKLSDMQYYYAEGDFNKNIELENKEFKEIDLIKTISIQIPDFDEMRTIVIGFMLDDSQLEILN